jgi:hypothetical protein
MFLEQRQSHRFNVRMSLRYRVSLKGSDSRWHSGVTRDMSKDGVSFKTRQPLPVGAHIELRIEWPARYDSTSQVDLLATGFVVRSDNSQTGVRISSHRFLVSPVPAELTKTA